MIDDGREPDSANAAEIGDGESSTFHLGRRQLLLFGFFRKLGQFDGKVHDIFLVHVANHWDQQPAVGVHRDANVGVLLVDDFLVFHVNAGIELREDLEGSGANFQRDGGDGHLAAGLFGLGTEAGAELLQFGDVGAVVLRDVRNRVPGLGEMLGGLAADAAHRDPLDFAPAREVRQSGFDEMSGTRRGRTGGRGEQCFGARLDVVLGNAAAGTGAGHLIKINAQFARQTADVRCGGNGPVLLRARDLAKLCGHAERRCSRRTRRVRRQRLFFGLAFGADGRLKRQSCPGLAGNVFHGGGLRATDFRHGGCALQQENQLADGDFLSLLDENVLHGPTDRGGNFDDGLVRFQFHDRLAFTDARSGCDHEADEIALRDVFAKFGQPELGNVVSGAARGGGR